MSSKSPPSVWRRYLALKARTLRGDRPRSEIEKNLVTETGERYLGENQLWRIESCEAGVPAALAEALFGYLGAEGEELSQLVRAAKMSRARPSATVPVPDWFKEFLVLEQDASIIFDLSDPFPPGMFQTESFARALITADSPHHVDEYVRARLDRQRILKEGVEYHSVIPETALLRVVGGREVMLEQTLHLIELSQLPNVKIQLIPRSAGAYRAMGRSFMLLGFREAPSYKIAYTEHGGGGAVYIETPETVLELERDYLHVASEALNRDDSREQLQQIARDYA